MSKGGTGSTPEDRLKALLVLPLPITVPYRMCDEEQCGRNAHESHCNCSLNGNLINVHEEGERNDANSSSSDAKSSKKMTLKLLVIIMAKVSDMSAPAKKPAERSVQKLASTRDRDGVRASMDQT